MDGRMMRDMGYLCTNPGGVVSACLTEIAMLPVDAQDPRLVADVLGCARVMDDPDNALVWPKAFARMSALLDELHERTDE